MNRTMQKIWLKKKPIGVLLGLVVGYWLLLRAKRYSYAASVVIPVVHPSDVWEYVADFSNMKHLNPTIESFKILSDSGTYEHWKYSLEYIEHLSHWPYLTSVNIAQFDVKGMPKHDLYYIYSSHQTCFVFGLFCLESTSEFKFTKSAQGGSFCEEHVYYQCPPLMSAFCGREVRYQRTEIMKNLKNHFTSVQG